MAGNKKNKHSPLALSYCGSSLEAGLDEAGRGCLAGPVIAAAVILPEHYENPLLRDSKMLSAKAREGLREEIQKVARAWAVGSASEGEIDKINILNASFLAMHRAVNGLQMVPDFLIVDGNRFKAFPGIPHACLVKGDDRFLSIAAASVLAKTFRDRVMMDLHLDYPVYHWDNNMGYPTRAHREAIRTHGPCPYHRRSFRLLNLQASFFWDENI
jgi:ribonuclease HII